MKYRVRQSDTKHLWLVEELINNEWKIFKIFLNQSKALVCLDHALEGVYDEQNI